MVADTAETFAFEGGEGEVNFDGDRVEEGAEPELGWEGESVVYFRRKGKRGAG